MPKRKRTKTCIALGCLLQVTKGKKHCSFHSGECVIEGCQNVHAPNSLICKDHIDSITEWQKRKDNFDDAIFKDLFDDLLPLTQNDIQFLDENLI